MILTHPFQQLSTETFDWLFRWSRILFWIVLALYAYVKYHSMPGKNTPDTILATPTEKMGALGFWIGFDYLFMLAYCLFFTVCCVWGAGQFGESSFFNILGIALAWAMIPQLLIDMGENWTMWQFALGKHSTSLEQAFRFLEKAKKPLFIGAAGYALVVSILKWVRVI